jgi:septum formation protein
MPALSTITPLLLASGSPRRRELLASVGIALEVQTFPTDEATRSDELPTAYLERVVAEKLRAAVVGDRGAHIAIVVADTIVVLGDRILGKPKDDDDARGMIEALSGRAHQVMTRFAVRRASDAAERAATVSTTVIVRPLAAAEIERYVATGEGRDKAGAYAIQGLFSFAIPRIDGSYSNVVGLPVSDVVDALLDLELLADFPS